MNKEFTVYIYSLSDPTSLEVKYVGKTIELQQRLWRHLCDTSNTQKALWIQTLLARGQKPILEVLETLQGPTDREWQTAEMVWILHFKEKGILLYNETTGGEGAVGHKHSFESKFRMSIRKTGSLCYRAKLTETQVLEIRERYAKGNVSIRKLANEYGIVNSGMGKVIAGETWINVGGPTTKPKLRNDILNNL